MNMEIEVKDIKIKFEFADEKMINKTLIAAMHYAQGGNFNDVFDVAQVYFKKEKTRATNFVKEVNGVKDFGDGKLTYKCKYECSSCGNKGIRYVVGDEEFVECHRCKEKLIVSQSTLNEAHDEDFNYFIAY